jgi:hypothetical protein
LHARRQIQVWARLLRVVGLCQKVRAVREGVTNRMARFRLGVTEQGLLGTFRDYGVSN